MHLTPKLLFKHPSIAELALVATCERHTDAEQGEVTGSVPLTPIQCWFFAQDWPEAHHFNQSMMLKLAQPIEPDKMREVIMHLTQHHDALRMRYQNGEKGWVQRCTGMHEQAEAPFSSHDFSNLSEAEARGEIEREAEKAQRSLSLEHGPIMRVIYFELGSERGGRLLIIIHHLVVDGVSWRILLSDLQVAYEQLKRGDAIGLPAKTTSYLSWAGRLEQYAHSQELESEAGYWSGVERRLSDQHSLPVSKDGSDHRSGRQMVVKVLSKEQTSNLLSEVGAAYHTQIQEVLLTALVEALWTWTSKRELVVQIEGHGREEFEQVDLTRTLGWFTTLYPLHLDLRRVHGVGQALKAVKEQIRAVPTKGMGYGIWKYLRNGDNTVVAGSEKEPEISFNYLGQFDQVLDIEGKMSAARESSGTGQSEKAVRSQKLEVSGSVIEGKLQFAWSYCSERFARETIERVAEQYMKELEKIIEHCRGDEAKGWTRSDFPLANLDNKTLDRFLAKLTKNTVVSSET